MRVCLLLLAVSVLLLSGCAASSNRANGVTDVSALAGSWTLVAIDGEPVSVLLKEGGTPPTLTIGDDHRMTGQSSVNRYMGEVDDEELTVGTFYVGAIAQTKMAGPEHLMRLESRYLARLAGPAEARVVDGELVISTNGNETLRFTLGVRKEDG